MLVLKNRNYIRAFYIGGYALCLRVSADFDNKVSSNLRGPGVLAAVFLTAEIQPLVRDCLCFREVQAALGATNHVFGGALGGGFRRSEVLDNAAERMDRQPNGNSDNNQSR